MKKILKSIFSLMFLISSFSFAKENIVVGVPKAPPAFPIIRMIETNALGDDYNLEMKVWTGPEILMGMVQGREAKFFAFPLTVVSIMYNKGLDVTLTNVNTWDITSIVSKNKDVKSFEDLKGKTIYVPIKTSTPDLYTQYFLNHAGLQKDKDFNIVYLNNRPELINMLLADKIEFAVLGEPDVTGISMRDKNVASILSFQKEWQKIKNDDKVNIPQAGFGTLKSFAKDNKELVKKFEQEYEKALNWIKENPKEAAKMIEKRLGIKAKVLEKALPKMGLHYVAASDAKNTLDEFYKMMYDFNPKSIGGKIPDEGIYFDK